MARPAKATDVYGNEDEAVAVVAEEEEVEKAFEEDLKVEVNEAVAGDARPTVRREARCWETSRAACLPCAARRVAIL